MNSLESSNHWQDQAVCRDLPADVNPVIFLEPKTESQIKRAMQICGGCAVRQECQEYAHEQPPEEIEGQVWGGQVMQVIRT